MNLHQRMIRYAVTNSSSERCVPMPDRDSSANDRENFVQQLAQQIHRYDVALEQMERVHGIFAASAIKLERYAQAFLAEVEQMKSHMAGVTPLGFEPTPPTI